MRRYYHCVCNTAITLYGNGQRSGVITNLTISEFEMREEEEEEGEKW